MSPRPPTRVLWPILALAILAAGPPAAATVADFKGFRDTTYLTNRVPGFTFRNATLLTAGITLNDFQFPLHPGTDVAFDDGRSIKSSPRSKGVSAVSPPTAWPFC